MFNKKTASEKKLVAAHKKEKIARAALQKKCKEKELEDYHKANFEVLFYERKIADEKGQAFAERIEFPYLWDTGAPLPHFFSNDSDAFLFFLGKIEDPNWDGTYVNEISPNDEPPMPWILVEFKQCLIAKFGSPNDETFGGHPLAGKGLELYAPMIVRNSTWIREVKAINKAHPSYKENYWSDYNHYLFGFHGNTFECIAKSFHAERQVILLEEFMKNVCLKLNS
ncbi:conserved hypothetical protein [Desulfatibacillum aliphaticivorans]|uniref:Uncharacterized protein n=1 Tax=Desulfatibacillum aliphaticivorans TaxID=218208 RepID=B8FA05_DESAL|nr:hypothetical protein [Desulfatibacillum aliphaticivorans]ACL03101.1 conserved hypothetical protein [Desulfatibacillum aliphaticivorans]